MSIVTAKVIPNQRVWYEELLIDDILMVLIKRNPN